ncbi:response regulator transcription factor [Streptomyces phaeochromogenes]|uniref:response regulator transcription factor n=1 Tax=Streptomyces phaeochromogenes TaxID=1923 RepID=UPI0036B60A83
MTEQSGAPGRAHPTGDTARPRLTPLEVKILRLMVQGKSLTQISHEVYISKGVLSRHVQLLMTSLGAIDREELAVKAEQEGLI